MPTEPTERRTDPAQDQPTAAGPAPEPPREPAAGPGESPLDRLDAAILDVLAVDGRASFARIGARVNLSAPAVKRRVDRLLARGVIDSFTVRLDPDALGWGTEAFVEVHCAEQTSPARMREAFEAYPEVIAASSVTGEADAVVQIRAHGMRHLEEVVERIAAEPFVRRTRSTVVLSPLVRRPLPPHADPA